MMLYEIEALKKLRGTKSIQNGMLLQMKTEALDFVEHFKDSPEWMSEWGHNYFCETDGERLIFDLKKPTHHECALCHKVYKSKQLDNVWVYFYRNEAILTLMKLALLYQVEKEEVYLNGYKKILEFYAENYTSFVLHAKDRVIDDLTFDVGGAGRLMPQGLNEAIVMIRIVTSLEILKDVLDQSFVDAITRQLLRPAIDVLKPQLVRIHNIPCWINAALGVIGLYSGDQELVDFIYHSEFGINEQLKQGVTSDYFWYEGSIHYNFFLLEGVVNLLAFTRIYNQPIKEEETVVAMLKQAYDYAFDNDVFPNPNDGWPNMNLKSYEYIYASAAKVFGQDSEVGNIYKNILNHPSERGIFPLSKPYYYNNEISFEQLIYFPTIDCSTAMPLSRESFCFENSYFAMLRNDAVNLFVKYGHQSPSHAHPDKMTIEVVLKDKVLTRDLSNSGYAATLCNEWHRTSLAHNTVIVDGNNQTSMAGGIVHHYDKDRCESFVKDVYEGVDYTRALTLQPEGFEDIFKVTSKDIHTYDWIFHSQATLLSAYEKEEAVLEFEENGYQHLQNIHRIITTDEVCVLDWELEGMRLKSKIDLGSYELYIAKTYDNPVSMNRTAIIIRAKQKEATFKIKWEVL